jgi:TolA-binding protein
VNDKKVIGQNVFIATIIACIVVAVALAGVLAIYLPMVSNLESQLTEKDQELTNLNTTITNLSLQMINLENQLEQANNAIASLRGNYDEVIQSYLNIIYLQSSGLLISGADFSQNANQSAQVFLQPLEYAGFVRIDIESNSTTTYAQVIYNSLGVNFNQKITIGESGSASFPVLPGEIEILVGNEESNNSVSGIVTANYVY